MSGRWAGLIFFFARVILCHMASLIVAEPGGIPRRVELGEGVHGIGRVHANAITLSGHDVSGRHAEIEHRAGRLVVRDLDSKNGTWVNGLRVSEREIVPGDRLRFGSVEVTVEASAERHGDGAKDFAPSQTVSSMDAVSTMSLDEFVSGVRAARAAGASEGSATEHRLRLMLKVGQMLSEPLAVDELLERILDVLAKLVDVGRGAVVLFNPATGAIEPRVVRGAVRTDKFYSATAVRWVCERRSAALFSDAATGPLGEVTSVREAAVVSAMCAPLLANDAVLGAIYVDNSSEDRHYTEEDLGLLAAFAGQASVAVGNAMLQARIKEEEVLRNSMLRFFPPTTVRRLREAGGGLDTIATIDAEVTILFSDISDFTGLSGRIEPREVVVLLNEYFPVMSEIVFRHEGALEKYIGDALLAIWGAPFAHPDDADRAVRVALEMQQAMAGFNERLRAAGREPLGIHIGLNTGRVAAGNIGSADYLQYATIGDATNVASRICSAAKDGEIVISESTRVRLTAAPCTIEPLGPVQVKGKAEPLVLHRLLWNAASPQ